MKHNKKELAKKFSPKIIVQSVEAYDSGTKYSYKWIGFNYYRELFECMKKTDDRNRCVSEMLRGCVKPYFDIDYDMTKRIPISKKEMDDIIEEFIDEVIDYIKEKGFTITRKDIVVGTSHKLIDSKYVKFSFHIIISPLKYNLLYENQEHGTINTACDFVHVLYKKDKKWKDFIDGQMYDKERTLRMFLNNKNPLDENIRLVEFDNKTMKSITFDEYKRTIITYIDAKKETFYIKTGKRMNPMNCFKEIKEQPEINCEKKKEYVFDGKITSNKDYFKNIVMALPMYHCLHFNNRSKIGMALKNQSIEDRINYFDIFLEFGLQKYPVELHEDKKKKLLTWWNSYNPKYMKNNIKIGSLIYILKKENRDLYDKINRSRKELNKKIATKFYNSDPTKYCGEIIKYNDKRTRQFVINKKSRGFIVSAGTGLGKTTTGFGQIKKHNEGEKIFLNYEKKYERILIITYRKTLCGKYYSDLTSMDFKLYSDIKGPISEDKVIVQLDSLHRVELESYDLVVCDEIECVLSHFNFAKMRKKKYNKMNFIHHLQTAKRLMFMDAFLSVKSFETLSHIINLKEITYIENSYQIIKNWKLTFVNNKEITDRIKKEKNRVFISSMSKSILETIAKNVPDILLYTSDTNEKDKINDMKDVNKTWLNKSVGHTGTIECGIDCTIPNQFVIYCFANNTTSSVTSLLQMMRRCRHPLVKEIVICYEHNENVESTHLDIESIENLIKYNLASCELSSSLELDVYVDKNKLAITKDFNYWLHVYNELETNLNRTYFLEILVYLAKKQGMIVSFSEDYNDVDEEIKKEICKDSKEKKKKELNELAIVDNVISTDEFEKLKSSKELDEAQKIQIKLKSALLRYKYSSKQYLELGDDDRKILLKFILKEQNYSTWKIASVISGDDINKKLNKLQISDIKNRDLQKEPNFKSVYAKCLLANELVKTIGYDSIKDDKKIDIKDINTKFVENTKRITDIYNVTNKLNKTKYNKINIQTINTIIKTIGLKLKRFYSVKNSVRKQLYKITDIVDWDNKIYPELDGKLNCSEPLFIEE